MTDEFDDIINEEYEYPTYASSTGIPDEEIAKIALELWKEQMIQDKKTDTLDGIIVLLLLLSTIGLFVWSAFDISWGQLRIVSAFTLLSVTFRYAAKIGKK